jgi:hypothetical protein
MEPSPLDAYVCPLFDTSCQSDHTSHIDHVPPTHGCESSPTQDNVKSPKAKTPMWMQHQSAMLKSAALGVGLRKKGKFKAHFPCMDSYANVTPIVSAKTPSVIQVNHIQFNPISNVLENPVQPITHDTSKVDEPRIKLQLNCEGDSVYVNLHLYEGLGHRLLQSDGTNTLLPPKGPFCQKNGKVRKSYRLPYFTDRHNWSLRDSYLEDIFEMAQQYDSANGHIFPDNDQWVDAFADPSGENAKFRKYWSPVHNAFRQNWSDVNVYAFPPMNDDMIAKTLQYHLAQQQIANSKGVAFRGIYIVPYQPSAKFWKYTSNFQLLKYFRVGTPMFQSAVKHGKSHTIQSSVPMCALYDMGYTLPNYQLAYLHAMDLASSALDRCEFDYPMEEFSWEDVPNNTSSTPSTRRQLSDAPTRPPEVYHINSMCSSQNGSHTVKATHIATNMGTHHNLCSNSPTLDFDGKIEDITPKSDIFQEHAKLAKIRVCNMLHCKGDPVEMISQVQTKLSTIDQELRKLSPIGKLANILGDDNPDWDSVDAAIMEHVDTLHQTQLENDQNPSTYDSIEPVDPAMFSKTWEEGGLLSKMCVRQIQSTPQVDPNILIGETCMVLKTKINNKHCNTSLVDEGATDSVLNVDWYEHHGIDWRKEFNVPIDATPGVVHMANQTPVATYGTARAKVTLLDAKGKSFSFPFHFMSLGKYNYAQILGIDWKNALQVATFNPEYKLWIRALDVEVIAKAMPLKIYHMMYNPKEEPSSPIEESTPKQISKDIRLLSARLRRMHINIPPTAFLRQIVVRPAKDEETHQVSDATPSFWKEDTSLQERATILRKRIEDTYRKAYHDVLEGEPHGINSAMPHQHVVEIKPGMEPFSRKLKRLSPLEIDLLSKYLKEMIDGGRIRPSNSPWGANVLFVPKPDGSYRCVQDYRELNKRMRHDTYPLPRVDVHLDMAQGVFWTKMDLLKGFYQLPMHPDSIKYTAFNTMLGKYEFLVMPMGLQNAPGSFMRAMNLIFDDLIWDPNSRKEAGILVYLDDIVIFSQTEDQHMEILKKVLDRLRAHKLQCRFDKCTFAVTEVEYLGFMLSHQGIRMNPDKVQVVKDWTENPTNKTEIRAFLGVVNYLKRFCKGLSHHSAILSDWSSEKNKDPWTSKHVEAMQNIKALLCSEEVLASPKIDPSTNNYYPFTVITDASEVAVGAILLQQQGDKVEDTKVIGYASSKFKSAEKNYSVHEKELLGVLMAVQHWNCFLEGSKFKVLTDHHSLIWLNKLSDPSRRQSRWVDILQGHDFEVLYIKGETNPADAFTRVPYEHDVVDDNNQPVDKSLVVLRTMRLALQDSNIQLKVTPSKLAEWQEDTRVLLTQPWKRPPLYKAISEAYALDPHFQDHQWLTVNRIMYKSGLYYKDNKVAIPDNLGLKIDVLVEHHDSLMGGHMGIDKTVEKISRLFWWPGMHTDIENHVRTCPACQVSKHRNWKPQGHTNDLKPATSPWEVVHVDFAGPFKSVSPGGYNRIVIFTCAFTKLAVFVKCKTTLTSEALADLYIQHIWRVYGRVGKLVSDNEPILCADAWLDIHKKLGTKLTHISAYNAKANGAAEVMVKQLKSMLTAFERQGLKWWRALAACERAYNDSVHSVTGYTPFFMQFGRHPLPDLNSYLGPDEDQLVQEFIHSTQAELAICHNDVHAKMLAETIRETAKRNAHRSPTLHYNIGDYVYLETSQMRNTPALAPLRSGPFKVTNIVAGGNALYLEGFRHPFNVELLTPTLGYASGITPHLTKHLLDLQDPTHSVLQSSVQISQGVAPTNAHGSIEVANLDGEVHVPDAGTHVPIPTLTQAPISSSAPSPADPAAQPNLTATASTDPTDAVVTLDLSVQTEEPNTDSDPSGIEDAVVEAVHEFLYTEPEALFETPAVRVVPNLPKPSSADIIRIKQSFNDQALPQASSTAVVAHSQQPPDTTSFAPVASPTHQPDIALDNYVFEVQPYVVSIDQLPSPVNGSS